MKDKSRLITILKALKMLLPGDYIKTLFYLNCIHKPRQFIRKCLNSFYRMDHIYDVIVEFKRTYKGSFSILEFGVGHGHAFTKKLYATQYLKMADRIMVHGFDSFEGMPESNHRSDQDIISGDSWAAGQFKGSYEALYEKCRSRYRNFQIHRGYFEETITEDVLESLRTFLPILVWIDCDYYTSTKTVFERLIPCIPSGCVIYFDEFEFNYGSRFTGEARIVHEINQGVFGEGIEVVLDPQLSWDSKRVYRFINRNSGPLYDRIAPKRSAGVLLPPSNDSPLP